MAINITIPELLQQVFGIGQEAFEPEFAQVTGSKPRDLNRKEFGASGSPYYATDGNGREYYMPVQITYTTDDETSITKKIDLPHPIVGITGSKNIVKTSLTDRGGTVKELISLDDYKITIRGVAVNKTNELPEDQVIQIRELWEQNSPVSISCVLTDIFLLRPQRMGSDKVVITDFRIIESEGVKNTRFYTMELLSDDIFSLIDVGS